MKGRIHSLESFGTVDGPGTRFVVFVQGCPMRCAYCHNPDTWDMDGGTMMEPEEIIEQYEKNRPFYKDGGLTVTGGEPLMQVDFLIDLFTLAKEHDIHTCIDSSGIAYKENNTAFIQKLDKLMPLTDLVMLDIKHIDEEGHRILTGQSGENIKEMARLMSDLGQPMWIRHVLVPERNDRDEYLHALAAFIRELKTVERVEVLPYHTLGIFKWENLGIPYSLEGISPPLPERVAHAKRILGIED